MTTNLFDSGISGLTWWEEVLGTLGWWLYCGMLIGAGVFLVVMGLMGVAEVLGGTR